MTLQEKRELLDFFKLEMALPDEIDGADTMHRIATCSPDLRARITMIRKLWFELDSRDRRPPPMVAKWEVERIQPKAGK